MLSLIRCLALLLALGAPAAAQNLFAPAARVNDRVITAYEVDQRVRMLGAFGVPSPTRERAIDDLVDERLQIAEAARRGVTATRQEVLEGQTEFAGRADLGREAFVARLGETGISEETFADFVAAGVLWRKVVQQAFGGPGADAPADVVARAAAAPPPPELRFLVSEIILPANTPQNAAISRELLPRIQAISSFSAFEAAAREYSASPSRDEGGRIDWLSASQLPPPITNALSSLSPGQVSRPFELPNAIAIFQLRQIGESAASGTVASLSYALLDIAGASTGAAQQTAATIAQRATGCDGIAPLGIDPAAISRQTQTPAEVPDDLELELARLDPGEVSVSQAPGDVLRLVMLCERTYAAAAEAPPTNILSARIRNTRIEQQANAYLAELRANAIITRP